MNEFTKEELEFLSGAMNSVSIFYKPDVAHKIRDKIQSMIDNYCEHELEPFTSFRDICGKCKRVF